MDRILLNLNPLTEYAILFISAVGLYFQLLWSRRGTTLGPTLLTTLGIFFCFIGIALGLADFDPNDVKNSVPHLLQGIRTSFWSSVAGIGWALTIKIRLVMFGDAKLSAQGPAHNATVDDLATQLVRLNTAVDGSNERLESMRRVFEASTERTALANAGALTGAMSQVVTDFNSKLNAQFGENFKELNIAVGRMLTWQVQYEAQLNSLIEQESATRETMTVVSQRFADLVDKSTIFSDTAASLEVLANLIDKASTGLPEIEKTIVEMTNQIARGVHTNQETLGAVLKSSWQSVQAHNQYLTAMLTKSLDAANRDVSAYSREAGSSVS